VESGRSKKCDRCGNQSNNENFDIPGMCFKWFKEPIFLCDKCIAQSILYRRVDWADEIKQFLTKK